MNCKLVLSLRSQFFHKRLFFSSQAQTITLLFIFFFFYSAFFLSLRTLVGLSGIKQLYTTKIKHHFTCILKH